MGKAYNIGLAAFAAIGYVDLMSNEINLCLTWQLLGLSCSAMTPVS